MKKVEALPAPKQITERSVADYSALQELVRSVGRACVSAEDVGAGQGIKLVAFLEKLQTKTWQGIKDAVSAYAKHPVSVRALA